MVSGVGNVLVAVASVMSPVSTVIVPVAIKPKDPLGPVVAFAGWAATANATEATAPARLTTIFLTLTS
jgi:hypothetical protein